MLPIENAAQKLGLRDDEWKLRGADRLALNAERAIDRLTMEKPLNGPLVALCDAGELCADTLRLGAALAHELSDLDNTMSAVAADSAGPRLPLSLLEIGAAHNALARALDEHLMSGNRARLDPRRLTWPRCISDSAPHRGLRRIVSGIDPEATLETIAREETFVTPAQSELVALLSIARSEDDLLARLERLIVGWRGNGEPIFAPAVLAVDELRALLPNDALDPLWIEEALPGGAAAIARFQHGGTIDWPFAGATALRAAQRLGGAIAVIGGGIPGLRNWFDVFCPACHLETRTIIIRASVESIRDFGAAANDGGDEWMAGLNALQNRVTLLDRFSLPPLIAVEAARGEYTAADSAVHVLESYGLRAIALERAATDDMNAPDVTALAAMAREWIHMQALPHPFIMAGRAIREQAVDIINSIYGAACEWSSAATTQIARIEQAGGREAPVVVEAENGWDTWVSSHALYGYSSPNAVITQVEWRAAAGYVKVTLRKSA